MKTLKIYAGVLIVSFGMWGCASTDTSATLDSTVSAEGSNADAPVEEQAVSDSTSKSEDPMDPETNMYDEGASRDVVSADNPIGRRPSIVALAQQMPELSTFLELVKAADMITILESPAPYTVFAPTNDAFDALPAGTVQALKQPGNQLELQRIIQSHVLPNRIAADEMQDNMPMMTAYGEEVVATRKGGTLKVGNATVLKPDLQASNGIVHIVDKVLAPPVEQE